MFRKGLVYNGHFLKIGQPRCDILHGDRTYYIEKFRHEHNLPNESKVIMFAPTFREGAKNGKRFVFSEIWSIDFERLLKNIGNIREHAGKIANLVEYGICVSEYIPSLQHHLKSIKMKGFKER